MPDIDPAALSRTDSTTTFNPSSLNIIKSNNAPPTTSTKPQKPANAAQRIDLEPLYTNLKATIGDHWARYKEAISLYILGHLNQTELSLQINHFVTADPNTEHLHNQLIAAIYGNVLRDVPDQGVAPWVSANDKPTLLSKPLVGDEAEQKLKREVMSLPARDRRRIKEVADTGTSRSENATYRPSPPKTLNSLPLPTSMLAWYPSATKNPYPTAAPTRRQNTWPLPSNIT
ncbi:MAG: hypothetical protein Q9183_006965 [Haloplaca sp. 2 TL-2023]